MNEDTIERVFLRRFKKTNLCENLVLHKIQRGAEVLFDKKWKRRLEACPDYVKVAAHVWIMARTNWQHYPAWRRFFAGHHDEIRRIWMDDHDLTVFRTFPKPFTLYRGYNKPHGKMGLSWTLDRAVAARIPLQPVHIIENPWIITAIANPEDVVVYTDGRREREVIIDPKRILKILKDEPAEKIDISEKQNKPGTPKTSRSTLIDVSSILSQLKCTTILKGSAGSGGTQISGQFFKVGMKKYFSIEGQKVEIRCLEIREESVLVKIAGVKEPQEIILNASGKRWKSYGDRDVFNPAA